MKSKDKSLLDSIIDVIKNILKINIKRFTIIAIVIFVIVVFSIIIFFNLVKLDGFLPVLEKGNNTETNLKNTTPHTSLKNITPNIISSNKASPINITPEKTIPSPSSKLTSVKLYTGTGTNSSNSFRSVSNTSDGGYIAAGTSNSLYGELSANKEQGNATLAKFDKNGNKKWFKSYGVRNEFGWSDYFNNVIQTSDGGFVAVGMFYSSDGDYPISKGNGDAIIIRIDKDGNKLWVASYGGSSIDIFESILQTSQGDFIVVGSTKSTDGDLTHLQINNWDAIMVKFDINGNKLWDISYGDNGYEKFNSVVQTEDDGYVAIGCYESAAIIIKFDCNGNKLWLKNYNEQTYNSFNSVIQTSNGDLCVVGVSSSVPRGYFDYNAQDKAIIIMFDSNGNKLWSQNYHSIGAIIFKAIIETHDKSLVVIGENTSLNSLDHVIYKIDNQGNVIWYKTFGLQNENIFKYDYIYSIIQLYDEGYVVCGSIEYREGGQCAIIYPFDSSGNLR